MTLSAIVGVRDAQQVPLRTDAAAAAGRGEVPLIVDLLIVAAPSLQMPPQQAAALELPLMVLLLIVSGPDVAIPPPLYPALPVTALLVSPSEPLSSSIPPPLLLDMPPRIFRYLKAALTALAGPTSKPRSMPLASTFARFLFELTIFSEPRMSRSPVAFRSWSPATFGIERLSRHAGLEDDRVVPRMVVGLGNRLAEGAVRVRAGVRGVVAQLVRDVGVRQRCRRQRQHRPERPEHGAQTPPLWNVRERKVTLAPPISAYRQGHSWQA